MRVNLNNLRNSINGKDSNHVELANGQFVDRDNVHYLLNGDVFSLYNGLSFEFHDNNFYEVKPELEEMTLTLNPIWVRTGKFYNMEEMNERFYKGE